MGAVEHHDAAFDDLVGQVGASLAHFGRVRTADESDGAFEGFALEQAVEFVRQAVVDGGFDVAVKAEHALAAFVVGAVLDVVLQDLRVPAGKGFFVRKALHRRLGIGPVVATFLADATGRKCADQGGAFGQAQGGGAPAAQHGRVDQHHTARQLGVAGSAHEAEDAAQ